MSTPFDPRALGCRCDTCILGPNGPIYDATTWRPVPPELRRGATLILIGEAPGEREVEVGMPFAGRSGEWLADALQHLGKSRKDVSITNAVLCRPPHNKFDMVLRKAKTLDDRVRRVAQAIKKASRKWTGANAVLATCVLVGAHALEGPAKGAWRENPVTACTGSGRLYREIKQGTKLGAGGHRYVVQLGNQALRSTLKRGNLHISTFRGSPLVVDDKELEGRATHDKDVEEGRQRVPARTRHARGALGGDRRQGAR